MSEGAKRYDRLRQSKPAVLASLLNLITAMTEIHLSAGTPLTYFKELIWDETMAQDRFFGWVEGTLLDQVRLAVQHGTFAPEPAPALFHPNATSSFKQIQFGEANVQLTFHENRKKKIDGADCIVVEPDIDYYNDSGGHTLLEVIPNTVLHRLTDPQVVYVLRWIAGRHSGVPDFNPPYTIE